MSQNHARLRTTRKTDCSCRTTRTGAGKALLGKHVQPQPQGQPACVWTHDVASPSTLKWCCPPPQAPRLSIRRHMLTSKHGRSLPKTRSRGVWTTFKVKSKQKENKKTACKDRAARAQTSPAELHYHRCQRSAWAWPCDNGQHWEPEMLLKALGGCTVAMGQISEASSIAFDSPPWKPFRSKPTHGNRTSNSTQARTKAIHDKHLLCSWGTPQKRGHHRRSICCYEMVIS